MKIAANKKRAEIKAVRVELPGEVLFGLRFSQAFLVLWLISDVIAALPVTAAWILVICRLFMIAGIFLLLRKRKLLGLNFVISGAAAGLIMNLILGFSIGPALVGSILLPLLLFLLIRRNREPFV